MLVRTAEQPDQALNVDLCFVPEKHTVQDKLPAVSGSSGRLIVERISTEGEAPHWPGQVFAEAGLDYEDAMQQYVSLTRDRLIRSKSASLLTEIEPSQWQQGREKRAERYRVREQRRQEDIVWKAVKTEHSQAARMYLALSPQVRKQQHTLWKAKEQAWWKLHKQRQQTIRQRQQEDLAWHQCNQALTTDPTSEAQTRAWIAILVVTDNCTRCCLGVPIFRTGAKLTSQEVVTALRVLLPKELAFLISDQGTHFTTAAFAQLAQEAGFIHVPVYRHRPQSNGIAERFVLTLKQWLRRHPWQTAEELDALLALFMPMYNDRPHQGLAIPGLSPNEFANRIWLM